MLALNAGSSSLKAAVFDVARGRRIAATRSALPSGEAPDEALACVLDALERVEGDALDGLAAVGHRMVHGGAGGHAPVRIDAAVEAGIAAAARLAPLHVPAALAVLGASRGRFPQVPQVAVFDTAFHATLPEAAACYALPAALVARHGLRRLGFHGINHAAVMRHAARALGIEVGAMRLVSCHLGAGASVAAIAHGRSVDTSMGCTPLEGLVMATRAGDLDPGLVLRLARAVVEAHGAAGLDGLEDLLQRRAGLEALAGSGDMRLLEARAAGGERAAKLAIDVYVHRLRRYLGAMCGVLGGADAIAFSGGVGEHSALVRARACADLGWLGARLDHAANEAAVVSPESPVARISAPSSAVRLLVVAADEERAIAEQVAALLSGRSGDETAS